MSNKISWVLIILICLYTDISGQEAGKKLIPADSKKISYVGRFDFTDARNPSFMYSGCAIRTVFEGTSVEILLKDDSLRNMFMVILDDTSFVLKTDLKENRYRLGYGLADGKHSLELIRRTEWHGGNTYFSGFLIDEKRKVRKPEVKDRIIEFIGDSYTCGYGNEGKSRDEHFRYETENNYLTFGALTARALDAEYVAICRSGIGMYQGYGGKKGFAMPLYYDTLVTGSKAIWNYQKNSPDIVAITLGANDMSRRFDSLQFVSAYMDFLTKLRKNYPASKIICIAGPSGDGEQWILKQTIIKSIVSRFSRNDKQVYYFAFSPFQMNGSDWHPNVAEHKRMADELIPYIKKITGW